MKKLNRKGFTLIELLAVITILGILMLVAIPAVSRTIENSRRDTFMDNAKEYIQTVRNAVLADEFECGGKSVSGTEDGTYYYVIDTETDEDGVKDLMEKVANSPWGGAKIKGYVKWVKEDGKITYHVFLTDVAKHGMWAEKEETALKRSDVIPNVSKKTCGTSACTGAPTTISGATACTLSK